MEIPSFGKRRFPDGIGLAPLSCFGLKYPSGTLLHRSFGRENGGETIPRGFFLVGEVTARHTASISGGNDWENSCRRAWRIGRAVSALLDGGLLRSSVPYLRTHGPFDGWSIRQPHCPAILTRKEPVKSIYRSIPDKKLICKLIWWYLNEQGEPL